MGRTSTGVRSPIVDPRCNVGMQSELVVEIQQSRGKLEVFDEMHMVRNVANQTDHLPRAESSNASALFRNRRSSVEKDETETGVSVISMLQNNS